MNDTNKQLEKIKYQLNTPLLKSQMSALKKFGINRFQSQLSIWDSIKLTQNQFNMLNSVKSIQNQCNILKDIKSFENRFNDLNNKNNKDDEFLSKMQKNRDEMVKQSRERYKREIENNESLKSIAKSSNETLKKINSLGETLNFLNSAFEDKVDFDKENLEQQNRLLLELITIINNKDKNKLKQFTDKIGLPVATELAIEYLKSIIGFK